MRNRLVHDYGNVDLEIVWETAQEHIPLALDVMRRLVPAWIQKVADPE